MKTNMKAMVLYGMFAGFAAETPDAGSMWSTARTFALYQYLRRTTHFSSVSCHIRFFNF